GNRIFEILTSFRFAPRSLAVENPAENLAKTRIGRPGKIHCLKAEAPAWFVTGRIEDSVGVEAVHVVELAFRRIAEDLIGFCDSLETVFSQVITRIDIRVIPPGKLPKRTPDFVY